MRRRSAIGAAWLMAAVALCPAATLSQSPSVSGGGLAARLPAVIDGGPVEVAFTQDMQTWVDELYPGEVHPEIEALQAALADQGRSLADVATVTAYFGPDAGGIIQGFGIPGGDAAGLQDSLVDSYLIGFGEMERTERDLGDHTVTFLSEGPLEAEAYPFAVLPDADVLWILNADMTRILDALVAILAVAAGTAAGNTASAPPPPTKIGPATWYGTMGETLTWNKGAYVGETTTNFKGTWERIEGEDVSYCPLGPCAAYVPMGEVEWTFESAAPGPPSCGNRQTGSVLTGDVVTPTDQMLFMEPVGTDHLGYWGSGTLFLPPQDCLGWEGISSPGAFFDIPMPDADHLFADVSTGARPGCGSVDWRITADATELKGTCWRYDESGYEQRFDWDLKNVDPE